MRSSAQLISFNFSYEFTLEWTIVNDCNKSVVWFGEPCRVAKRVSLPGWLSPMRPRDIIAGNSRRDRKSLWVASRFYYERKFRASTKLYISNSNKYNIQAIKFILKKGQEICVWIWRLAWIQEEKEKTCYLLYATLTDSFDEDIPEKWTPCWQNHSMIYFLFQTYQISQDSRI